MNGSAPLRLYKEYDAWAAKHDPEGKVTIDVNSKGANQNGLLTLNKSPRKRDIDFDAVVNAGESIQAAIEKAHIDAENMVKAAEEKKDKVVDYIVERIVRSGVNS